MIREFLDELKFGIKFLKEDPGSEDGGGMYSDDDYAEIGSGEVGGAWGGSPESNYSESNEPTPFSGAPSSVPEVPSVPQSTPNESPSRIWDEYDKPWAPIKSNVDLTGIPLDKQEDSRRILEAIDNLQVREAARNLLANKASERDMKVLNLSPELTPTGSGHLSNLGAALVGLASGREVSTRESPFGNLSSLYGGGLSIDKSIKGLENTWGFEYTSKKNLIDPGVTKFAWNPESGERMSWYVGPQLQEAVLKGYGIQGKYGTQEFDTNLQYWGKEKGLWGADIANALRMTPGLNPESAGVATGTYSDYYFGASKTTPFGSKPRDTNDKLSNPFLRGTTPDLRLDPTSPLYNPPEKTFAEKMQGATFSPLSTKESPISPQSRAFWDVGKVYAAGPEDQKVGEIHDLGGGMWGASYSYPTSYGTYIGRNMDLTSKEAAVKWLADNGYRAPGSKEGESKLPWDVIPGQKEGAPTWEPLKSSGFNWSNPFGEFGKAIQGWSSSLRPEAKQGIENLGNSAITALFPPGGAYLAAQKINRDNPELGNKIGSWVEENKDKLVGAWNVGVFPPLGYISSLANEARQVEKTGTSPLVEVLRTLYKESQEGPLAYSGIPPLDITSMALRFSGNRNRTLEGVQEGLGFIGGSVALAAITAPAIASVVGRGVGTAIQGSRSLVPAAEATKQGINWSGWIGSKLVEGAKGVGYFTAGAATGEVVTGGAAVIAGEGSNIKERYLSGTEKLYGKDSDYGKFFNTMASNPITGFMVAGPMSILNPNPMAAEMYKQHGDKGLAVSLIPNFGAIGAPTWLNWDKASVPEKISSIAFTAGQFLMPAASGLAARGTGSGLRALAGAGGTSISRPLTSGVVGFSESLGKQFTPNIFSGIRSGGLQTQVPYYVGRALGVATRVGLAPYTGIASLGKAEIGAFGQAAKGFYNVSQKVGGFSPEAAFMPKGFRQSVPFTDTSTFSRTVRVAEPETKPLVKSWPYVVVSPPLLPTERGLVPITPSNMPSVISEMNKSLDRPRDREEQRTKLTLAERLGIQRQSYDTGVIIPPRRIPDVPVKPYLIVPPSSTPSKIPSTVPQVVPRPVPTITPVTTPVTIPTPMPIPVRIPVRTPITTVVTTKLSLPPLVPFPTVNTGGGGGHVGGPIDREPVGIWDFAGIKIYAPSPLPGGGIVGGRQGAKSIKYGRQEARTRIGKTARSKIGGGLAIGRTRKIIG